MNHSHQKLLGLYLFDTICITNLLEESAVAKTVATPSAKWSTTYASVAFSRASLLNASVPKCIEIEPCVHTALPRILLLDPMVWGQKLPGR